MRSAARAKRVLGLAAYIAATTIGSCVTEISVKSNPTKTLTASNGADIVCAPNKWYALRAMVWSAELGCYNKGALSPASERTYLGAGFFNANDQTGQTFSCLGELYNPIGFANPSYTCRRQKP